MALAAAEQRIAVLEGARIDFLFAWMTTANPMLGNFKPLDMMRLGRGDKLAQFIEQAKEDHEANKAARIAAAGTEQACERCADNGLTTCDCAERKKWDSEQGGES
jgi:hypothetical protein